MESNYYYLFSSLPELTFNEKTDYRELYYLFEESMEILAEEDKISMTYVRYPIDNANAIHLLEGREEKFMNGGNYSLKELKSEIETLDTLPLYMVQFLQMYKQFQAPFNNQNLIDLLNEMFYSQVLKIIDSNFDRETSQESDFIKLWYGFERDLKNVLTVQECNLHNISIERRETFRLSQKKGQLLSGDYDITNSLLHSKAYDYSLTGALTWMPSVLKLKSENIEQYEKEILMIKLDMLDEFTEGETFSLNLILSFFIKLQLLIRWSSLDEVSGKNFIENLSGKAVAHAKHIFV